MRNTYIAEKARCWFCGEWKEGADSKCWNCYSEGRSRKDQARILADRFSNIEVEAHIRDCVCGTGHLVIAGSPCRLLAENRRR